MKKLAIICGLFILVASCKKDISNLNDEPKRPTTVPPETLFSSGQKNLVDLVASSNVNLNIFRLIAQYWTETTYTDESNYDLITRNIPQNFWNTMYTGVLKNFADAAATVPLQDTKYVSAQTITNQMAMIEIMNVYAYSQLVNTFGDIPYSQALDINNVHPKYDDDKVIYDSLLVRLDAALAKLNTSGNGFGNNDLLYGGDVGLWKKFGNSLKLRLGMMIADDNAAKAKTIVEAAAPNVFTSNEDNAAFHYLTAPPNTNPVWVDLIQSGRKDFVAAAPIVDTLKSLSDPRIPFYFTEDENGDYTGGDVGQGNTFSVFSKPGAMITAPDFEALLIDYSEVEFLLAEAAARGMSVGGTAATHYNNAITASITYWGGTTSEAAAYLLTPKVNYLTAGGTYKQKIGLQKWIALYNRGLDAWTEIRRLDAPALTAPSTALSAYPLRLTYPVQEQNLNTANYNAAAAAIGGDVVTSKIFWDKF